ncbi:MAG: hypothetical protein H7Y33_08275 [Cytophagales bacterium]|nr:hypothetical protein [Rhizobacter sp.]
MHKTPVKYLVLIESDGAMLAKLYDGQFAHVNDIDASSEEVAVMTKGLMPQRDANNTVWAPILAGHGEPQRRVALVFTLDV